ncbi:MAG: molybdenum cofactor biosynthesis protein MoaE [Pyrinomonadaceae bacterium]
MTSGTHSQGELHAKEQPQDIRVRVLFFGAARDAAGSTEVEMLLHGAVTAALAFEEVLKRYPTLRRFGRSLLLAVNQEYAGADREVQDGDELAVFPPVSGGSQKVTNADRPDDSASTVPTGPDPTDIDLLDTRRTEGAVDFFEITTNAIDVGAVARRVVLAECGATVTLDGYAREWTGGRRTLYLIYETYESMALSELRRLGCKAHERFEIAHIGVVHRTGRLEIGETSVVIAVSAPHRRAAFEACEWAISELKRTVPIWKKEVFEDGEVWVEGEATGPPGSTPL